MDQNPDNRQEKDNLKESCEHFDASNGNGKDMKNIEEKMQKLEIEGTENQKMEGQLEIEKCNEANLPDWHYEVLKWIKRMEMVNSGLSTSSWIFHRLCEPKLHGNVKPHMVGPMELGRDWHWDWDVPGNMQNMTMARYGDQFLPIPSTLPPDYILGFKRISIFFLDDRVLEFVKCISPKLEGIKFVVKMDFDGWKNEGDERTQALKCLLDALTGRIGQFHFKWFSNFKKFTSLFPNFIDQCQCILISQILYKPGFDVLFEWLTNRRQMDATKQKILKHITYPFFAYFFGRIKEEFSNSTKSLNFLINFFIRNATYEEYDLDLENENTDEVLISYFSQEFGGRMILRCPKGQEERWKEEGEKKMRMLTATPDDVTSIKLNIYFEPTRCGMKCALL